MKYNSIVILLVAFGASCAENIHPTHWVVTETGLIKPKYDSPYQIAHPHDLLAFLNQETLWNEILENYHDLARRQVEIDKLWYNFDNHTNIEKHMASNKNCVQGGMLKSPPIDWYIFLLEQELSKKIAEQDLLFNFNEIRLGPDTDVPDCKKISLTFSFFAFEHLEGMRTRDNLSITPDISLLEHITQIMSLGQFGHWVSNVLKQNSTSWLHYKFAAMYWIMHGNAPKALECCRRAVHYAPRAYKDIALSTLGVVLHRSQVTQDAITVLTAALDHGPNCRMNHFYLANAYAVLGDYNMSMKHFNRSLDINPGFEMAEKHKNALLCLAFLDEIMNSTRSTITNLHRAVEEYFSIEQKWFKTQVNLLKTMNHKEEYDYTNQDKNFDKLTDLTNLNIKGMKNKSDKNFMIKYFFDTPAYERFWLETKGVDVIKAMESFRNFIKHVGTSKFKKWGDLALVRKHMYMSMFQEEIAGLTPFSEPSNAAEQNTKFNYETGIILFPPLMKISRNIEDFDVEADWPTDMFCLEKVATFPANVEGIYQVFLPFENKGIRLTSLLTDMIGVKADEEHEVPWHPPNCAQDKDVVAFAQKKTNKQTSLGEVINDGYLRHKLLEYVSDGQVSVVSKMQDAEIGHRIYAAMQQQLVPTWITSTLASLYWRVRSNNMNALHCLVSSSKSVPGQYKDIVMTSLSSVYLEMGYFDEALDAAETSFKMSPYEPATNFMLSTLNMIKKHRHAHMFHLKQVVRIDGMFMSGIGRRLLDAWACILKQIDSVHDKAEYALGETCTSVEPGINMVCERDGTNCHVTSNKCQIHEKGALAWAWWWCGAGGRGACARRCLSAAHARAARADNAPLTALAALLLLQSKKEDAKDIAYLAFYSSPKGKMESFLVATAHAYMTEHEQAIWMYRFTITKDEYFIPAKACLHASICLMLFGKEK